MSRLTLAAVLDRATAEGLLPDAAPPSGDERPWPVVVMTAIGAWIAAVPMCLLVGVLFWPMLANNAGSYIVGMAVLGGSLVVLRAPGTPLFLEQIAIPGMLVGKGVLVYSLWRDTPFAVACFVSALLSLGAAAVVPMAWLRTLLGIVAAMWTGTAMLFAAGFRWSQGQTDVGWWVLHALLVVWALAMAGQRHASAAVAAWLEALATGWLIVVVGGLAWLTGATFLVGSMGADMPTEMSYRPFGIEMAIVSGALALAASAWLPRQWPSLRKAALVALPLVAVPLAAMMPSLGAVLLVTAVCAAAARWRQAALGALAAAWIIGAFYYQLSWTLVMKAYVMVLAGGLLGAAAWHLRTGSSAAHATEARLRAPAVLVIGATLLTLLVANVGIWQKQHLIANGRVVLVPLGPVDPRSLMQGDYMTLEFPTLPIPSDAADPVVVLALDERGVASSVHTEGEGAATPLAPNQVRVRMIFKGGRWKLVTDAWHFAEGQGDRFALARFGEFRVMDDGRALLVGMRDANLQPIHP